MDSLAIPDDAAEYPAECQKDLLCGVPGSRLACMASLHEPLLPWLFMKCSKSLLEGHSLSVYEAA